MKPNKVSAIILLFCNLILIASDAQLQIAI